MLTCSRISTKLKTAKKGGEVPKLDSRKRFQERKTLTLKALKPKLIRLRHLLSKFENYKTKIKSCTTRLSSTKLSPKRTKWQIKN